jgi:hypothetical protein
MIVLHGSWLPAPGGDAAVFALWAETTQHGQLPPRPRGRARKGAAGASAHPHPFAAGTAELRAALPTPA